MKREVERKRERQRERKREREWKRERKIVTGRLAGCLKIIWT
jgi:hypothetical protein